MPATHSGAHPPHRQRRWARAAAAAALALVSSAATITGTVVPAAPAAAVTLPIVAAGGGHTCSIMADQSVWCWGQNTTGQLGNGTVADSTVPAQVAGLPPAVDVAGGQIALGDAYTCALLNSGDVECWGWNNFGELGDGSATDSTSPVSVTGIGPGVRAIAAGDATMCAILISAQVTCWGDNTQGELGNGSLGGQSDTPVTVSGGAFLSDGASIGLSMGQTSCGLDNNEVAQCWGFNGDGEMGDGTTTSSGTPAVVQGL